MKTIVFVTGNHEKVRDAQYVAREYNIEVIQLEADIDEIQHHDATKIAEHKARAAYDQAQQPVVVNDSFWSIPALGGFPGGYMKDVAAWFEAEDFLNLMKTKTDKTIVLTDVNGFFDGTTYKSFETKRYGKFIDTPRGYKGPSFSKVVIMEDDAITISEIFDQPSRTVDSKRYAQWHDFMKWYSAR